MVAALLVRAEMGVRAIRVGAAVHPSFRCFDDIAVVVDGLIVEGLGV
jgi:hypothetical protein